MWTETAEQWRGQGWDGRPLPEVFGTDGYFELSPYYGPQPPFAYEVVEEDEATRVYVNHEGILLREFKEHADQSMPQFLRFPVETEADFEQLCAERLQPSLSGRLPAPWRGHAAYAEESGLPRRVWPGRWGGFFGALRNLMGLENLCLAFYDQPALVDRMMGRSAELMIRVTEAVMEHATVDVFWFWEDMAHNHASLIDPRLFRRVAMPHYRRVIDWLRSRGVEHIGLDSDGDITELIPLWLDAGINFLWPFEVAAGMDVVAVRREYGHALAMGGGIDKRAVARGGDAMRTEVDQVMPLMDDGGYLPELDHGAPPDISYGAFRDYIEYLLRRLERG
ncbi:MAG: hypothetical protein HYU66_12940 [Armatimonadetes bacterium]|nr:hypothetical protein [Armatimonadota bacterium]